MAGVPDGFIGHRQPAAKGLFRRWRQREDNDSLCATGVESAARGLVVERAGRRRESESVVDGAASELAELEFGRLSEFYFGGRTRQKRVGVRFGMKAREPIIAPTFRVQVALRKLMRSDRWIPGYYEPKFQTNERALRKLKSVPLGNFIPDEMPDGSKGITYGQVGARKLSPNGAVRYLQVINI